MNSHLTHGLKGDANCQCYIFKRNSFKSSSCIFVRLGHHLFNHWAIISRRSLITFLFKFKGNTSCERTDLISAKCTDFRNALLIADAFHYPSFPDLLLTAFNPPPHKLIIHVLCSHRSARHNSECLETKVVVQNKIQNQYEAFQTLGRNQLPSDLTKRKRRTCCRGFWCLWAQTVTTDSLLLLLMGAFHS